MDLGWEWKEARKDEAERQGRVSWQVGGNPHPRYSLIWKSRTPYPAVACVRTVMEEAIVLALLELKES
jgi:hypothetical protein